MLLLHHNASSIGVVDSSGNTALHWAALNGHESVCRLLIINIRHAGYQDLLLQDQEPGLQDPDQDQDLESQNQDQDVLSQEAKSTISAV